MQVLTKSQKKRLAKKKAKAKAELASEGGAEDTEAAVDTENNNSGHPNGATPNAANPEDSQATEEAKKKTKKKKKSGAAKCQTEPPTIPLSDFFPDGRYPEGEWQSYKDEFAPSCRQTGP